MLSSSRSGLASLWKESTVSGFVRVPLRVRVWGSGFFRVPLRVKGLGLARVLHAAGGGGHTISLEPYSP